MKAQKLNLFALLVSIALLASCQKEDDLSPAKSVPTEQGTVWDFFVYVPKQGGSTDLVRVDGTLTMFKEYHVKRYVYVDNKLHVDTFAHELHQDSIVWYTNDNVPKMVSGKHYVQNDTLYSAIPPGVFY